MCTLYHISVAFEIKLQLWCNSLKEEEAHKSKCFKTVFHRSKIQFSQSGNEDDEEEEELQLDFANPSKCKTHIVACDYTSSKKEKS
jgi:hypothetical protein